MVKKRTACTRIVSSLVAAATLAVVGAAPAQANIPPVGSEFQIKTVFEGAFMCVSSEMKDASTYALVPCDREAANQHWKRTPNGRGIVSVATGNCLATDSIGGALCKHGKPGAEPWHQGRYGRVWRKGGDSITKTFWHTFRHNFHGPVLGFLTRTNGTTPEETGFFAFDMV
ncbi:hypothetical protein [Streptomyces sp. YGL11-2]|uniref:hypothetical protein n=1 Tax=Streptomyces sp. YGL11-2 TaxID=3414028 RepID=UPI003CF7D195